LGKVGTLIWWSGVLCDALSRPYELNLVIGKTVFARSAESALPSWLNTKHIAVALVPVG